MFHLVPKLFAKEFASVHHLVRFGIEPGVKAQTFPRLFLKATTLALKHLIKSNELQLSLGPISANPHLCYFVTIADDPMAPVRCWSLVETEDELAAIRAVLAGVPCSIFLLNEQGLNVCRTSGIFHVLPTGREIIFDRLTLCPLGASSRHSEAVGPLLDSPSTFKLLTATCNWEEQLNVLITDQATTSEILIITGNEGQQQEELALWLIDMLHAPDLVKQPQVREGKKQRELSDLLLNYEHGCILLESKGLAIFERTGPPSRERLKKTMEKHVAIAARQLQGACNNIKRGYPVTTNDGEIITIQLDQPIHCLIVIPDLSLLDHCTRVGGDAIRKFMKNTECFLHILDVSELRSTVRNSLMISQKSKRTSPMMVFDGILIKRSQVAVQQVTPYFSFRIKMS